MDDYTRQVLRVVVAQVCQTIGWHSIQTTPLELLTDILHKYMQELSRETYRHSELYGRTEANLEDVGLSFLNLNIDIPDLLEYINNVDSVHCALEVPKYPVRKDSNLNFLKPGSKEVITRPVHIHEHLPPIYPEKEGIVERQSPDPRTHISQQISFVPEKLENPNQENSENGIDVIACSSTTENGLFKKPEISEPPPVIKKPRVLYEEEGRPTREISSVMMTSSGFISPAREGKLPDSKTPVLPGTSATNYTQPQQSTKPTQIEAKPSTFAVSSTPAPPAALPLEILEHKFDKKTKKRSAGTYKERKRDKQQSKDPATKTSQKVNKPQKVRKNKIKNTSGAMDSSIMQPLSIALPAETTIRSEPNATLLAPVPPPAIASTSAQSGISSISHNFDRNDEVKLNCEPDKQKLNIFKKISTKKERDDMQKSPSLFGASPFPLSFPESTTIHPVLPPRAEAEIPQDPNVILVNDDIQPSVMLMQRPPGKSGATRKGRKRSHQATEQQPQQQQAIPLNLSTEISSPEVFTPKLPKPPRRKNKPRPVDIIPELMHPGMGFNMMGERPSLQDNPFMPDNKGKPPGKIDPLKGPRYLPSNFPLPHMSVFSFYPPFNATPGLIPSNPFTSLPPMAYPLSMYNSFKRLPFIQKVEDKTESTPPPPPPIDIDKSYCNVAPLVPENMKLQLSPTPKSKSSYVTSTVTSASACMTTVTAPIQQNVENTTASAPSKAKSPKILDAPIEISDDETPSEGEQKLPETPSALTTSSPEPQNNLQETQDTKGTDGAEDEDREEAARSDREENEERVEKAERRKDKEHKKGKRGKDGKIKKKKDKKDKSRSKDKAEKRREREEKKDKERLKKLKKEKKREKARALAFGDDNRPHSSRYDPQEGGSVPKLTLKLGSPLPDSPEGRKFTARSQIDDVRDESLEEFRVSPDGHRESSPELARISPLVTRPPKQKPNSKDKTSDTEPCTSSLVTSSVPAARGPGRPRGSGNSTTHHTTVISSNAVSSTSGNTPTSSTSSAGVTSSPVATPSSSAAAGASGSHNQAVHSTDAEGNQVWICPACGRVDDGTPMIGCDGCDAWYHWVCVGIQVPPDDNEDWYCRVCIAKKQEAHGTDKKRKRKKKNKNN